MKKYMVRHLKNGVWGWNYVWATDDEDAKVVVMLYNRTLNPKSEFIELV